MRFLSYKRGKSTGLFSYACYCFAFAVFFILCKHFFYSSKPDQASSALVTTAGELYAVAPGSQYSTDFIVRKKDGGLIKFTAVPAYTDLSQDIRSHVRDGIVVSHYNKMVVECRIGGAEFCSPKCFSDFSCRMKVYEANVSSLRKCSYIMFFIGVGFLLAFVCQKPRS